MTLIITD